MKFLPIFYCYLYLGYVFPSPIKPCTYTILCTLIYVRLGEDCCGGIEEISNYAEISGPFTLTFLMTATGRVLLYALTGIVVPVYAS